MYKTNNVKQGGKELLFSVTADDCEWDYFKGSGPGGQKRNKTENCARCKHLPSGAVGLGQNGRSKQDNKIRAFKKMIETNTFKTWHHIEICRRLGMESEIEQKVIAQMRRENLKIEHQQNGEWVIDNE